MGLPPEKYTFSSGDDFVEDLYVYGCLYLTNPNCGIVFKSPNGDTYNIFLSNGGVGIGGGGGGGAGGLNLTGPNGNVYRIEASNDGIVFTTPDSNNDGTPDNGYTDITANGFKKVGGGSTQFLMADGSVSTRYISTETTAPNSGIGTDGDTYLIVNC